MILSHSFGSYSSDAGFRKQHVVLRRLLREAKISTRRTGGRLSALGCRRSYVGSLGGLLTRGRARGGSLSIHLGRIGANYRMVTCRARRLRRTLSEGGKHCDRLFRRVSRVVAVSG